jgi:putative transposase
MLSRKSLQIWPKKQTEYLWTNKYSSPIYQHAFRDLKKAFSRWKAPKIKAELPRFKKKKHNCSFTVDSSNGKVLVTEEKKIKIPTLGTFRFKEAIPNKLCFSDLYYI